MHTYAVMFPVKWVNEDGWVTGRRSANSLHQTWFIIFRSLSQVSHIQEARLTLSDSIWERRLFARLRQPWSSQPGCFRSCSQCRVLTSWNKQNRLVSSRLISSQRCHQKALLQRCRPGLQCVLHWLHILSGNQERHIKGTFLFGIRSFSNKK